MKNNLLTNSDINSQSRRKKSHPIATARQNTQQTHLFQTIYKTPEKSSIFRQKTPSTQTKIKTYNPECKENEISTINKNSSSKKSSRQTHQKQPSNLMKQINQKLNQKSVSVPDILEETTESNKINQLGFTQFQRTFAQNRVIKIQDLFSQNQITLKELEKNWQTQITQESELIKSIQHQDYTQQSRCDSKENLLNSVVHIENSTSHLPLIYIIDLASL